MSASFDELKTLFEEDPVAAEDKVKEILEEYISSLDEERQQRARAFNWRLQQDLRKYKDPVARMNVMVEKFWAGVQEFQQALEGKHPDQIFDQRGSPSDVIKFPKQK